MFSDFQSNDFYFTPASPNLSTILLRILESAGCDELAVLKSISEILQRGERQALT